MPTSIQERLNRINFIKNTFIRADEKNMGIMSKFIINEMILEWGIRKEKAQEYIDLLIDSNFIELKEGILYLKKDKNKEFQSLI